MITCNCPPSASLPDLECVKCPERFEQIQKVAFQRVMNDDGTKNKFSAVSGFSEINSLANWQARMTANDSTKIVLSPYIYSPTQETGAPRTFGGGNDGLGGIEEIIGREPSSFTGSLRNIPQSVAKVLKSLQCESEGGNLGVYLIDENGNVEGISTDNTDYIYPIPVRSFFVGDKVHGGIDNPDTNAIQWSFMPNYSDDLKIFTITTFNPLADLCVGGAAPTLPPAYPTALNIKAQLGTAETTSVKFVHTYDVSGYTLWSTIADGLISVYKKDGETIFMYEGDIYAPDNCGSLFELPLLQSIDFTNFNTSNVTRMYSMFDGCELLSSLDLSNFNTANVTDMNHMFGSCEALETLNISNFNTANVTDMRNMFYTCTALTTIYAPDFVKHPSLQSNDMFRDCPNLVGGNGTQYNSSHTDATYARVDRAGVPGYFTQA